MYFHVSVEIKILLTFTTINSSVARGTARRAASTVDKTAGLVDTVTLPLTFQSISIKWTMDICEEILNCFTKHLKSVEKLNLYSFLNESSIIVKVPFL